MVIPFLKIGKFVSNTVFLADLGLQANRFYQKHLGGSSKSDSKEIKIDKEKVEALKSLLKESVEERVKHFTTHITLLKNRVNLLENKISQQNKALLIAYESSKNSRQLTEEELLALEKAIEPLIYSEDSKRVPINIHMDNSALRRGTENEDSSG